MYSMSLTKRQQQVWEFIRQQQDGGGHAPSLREIARQFGFRSVNAAADHVRALAGKGFLQRRNGRARSLRAISPLDELRRPVVNIPVYGTIPAGFATEQRQEATGCISVDIESLGIRPTTRTFALQVRGDSMIGKHIVDGDYAIFEHGVSPKSGDVVAALIDNESTIKTFLLERGKPCLRAENPKYPKLIPATELVIQGVLVALIRKRK
jgi:repressor LexA